MALQCNAKAKSTGERCKQYAVEGSTKCRYHGGKTPKGIASPHFVDGHRSKYLPTRMIADFEASLSDPNLLELRNEISLLDARLNDLLKRVDTGESGNLWKQARDAYQDFRDASAAGDALALQKALSKLEGLLARGVSDYAAWDEVGNTIEQRRRLVETERKRLVDMQLMVRADQFALFVSALAASVREHVTDKHALAAISADIAKLVRSHERIPEGD